MNEEKAPPPGVDPEFQQSDWQKKAVDKVLDDFKRAKKFMEPFHKETLERYGHYRSGQLEQNVNQKKRTFPVPFTTEQVDSLVNDMMDKLFFKNKPCSIYGREDSDVGDAEAKQAMFEFQDSIIHTESKVRKALTTCCIAGVVPAMVNYEEIFTTEVVEREEPVVDEMGNMIIGPDGVPLGVPYTAEEEVPEYMGATFEPISITDFFVVPEKKEIKDEEPLLVRNRVRPTFFKSKPYFFNQDKIVKTGSDSEHNDLDKERREQLGLEFGDDYYKDHCIYLEWQGYYDPKGEAVDEEDKEYEPGFYVIGIVVGNNIEETLVRFDEKPFPIKGPNIVLGSLIEEDGEVISPRFVDKFHAVQHAQDTVMGMWFESLKQLVKRPKIVNSDALLDASQINTAVDETIEVSSHEDVDKAVKFIDVPNISPDIYNGIAMLRDMGQNASSRHDIAEGKAQTGVETLGEANILASKSDVAVNAFLKTFERTFIQPLYSMRNSFNAKFLTAPYVISVIGEKGLEWRTLEPGLIRAQVDFVCEASTRETQRGVIAQQIIQALGPLTQIFQMYVQLGYPPPMLPRVDILMGELLEQWSWASDKIEKIIPSIKLGEDDSMAFMPQMAMQPGMPQGGGGGQQPQPRNEQEAVLSAQAKNQTQVGRM